MGEFSTIGVDLAKSVFQVHGADASGAVLFRKKLRRHQVSLSLPPSGPARWRWRPVAARTTGRVRLAGSGIRSD